ncbi:MAG TPA: hypothetical protein VFO77_13070 [Actinoplanes sp.]|nr:hypothetical protein [Actinoplanes sp.]
MTIHSENHSNGSSTAHDRFSAGVSAFRQNRRDAALTAEANNDNELATRSSASIEPTGAFDRAPSLPSLDLHGLTEPVFPPTGWMEPSQNARQLSSMADHPLLRGLLLELPARGTIPDASWLDRWFEAARSILELLYVQEANR